MAEPLTTRSFSNVEEGPKYRFNCLKNSDVLLIADGSHRRNLAERAARKSVRPKRTSITLRAHKEVLSAGSRAFERYFAAQAQATRDPSDNASNELATTDIHYCMKKTTVTVVRYLYGLPTFPEDKDSQHTNTIGENSRKDEAHSSCSHDKDPVPAERGSLDDWINLYDAAEGFEVPGLLQLALGRNEAELKSRFAAIDFDDKGTVDGDADGASHFVEAVQCIYEDAMRGDETGAKKLAASMCGEHYTKLRGFESFQDFIEYHSEFVRELLDFVVGRAEGVVGEQA